MNAESVTAESVTAESVTAVSVTAGAGPILHVDMDAFYASVELRRRPALAGRPVVVGGLGPRGVVSSASYPARERGVRSAMPTAKARRLCPDGEFLPPDMAEYARVSRLVMATFADFTPLVEPLSVDEAFLDVSGAVRLFGTPVSIGAAIRARIRSELGLTCSVGVAATKFVAKLASTRAKPDGLLAVADALGFLHPLPVSALWGVGERTEAQLHRLGLMTVADVAAAPASMLHQALGEVGAHLHELAWARDPRPVAGRADKSIGAETTFDVDVDDSDTVRRTLLELAARVGSRLRRSGQAGRTVALKVRRADFKTLTRSRTLSATDVTREIFESAWALYQALRPGRVRLVGVRIEGLTNANQPALGEARWRDAERAVDAAAAKGLAVRPASLLRAQ